MQKSPSSTYFFSFKICVYGFYANVNRFHVKKMISGMFFFISSPPISAEVNANARQEVYGGKDQ